MLFGIIGHQEIVIYTKAFNKNKIITGAIKGTSARKLREELASVKLKTRRKIHKIIFFYKSVNRMTPAYISDLVPLRVGERSNIC
jgi:hypothetical protein